MASTATVKKAQRKII